MRNLALIALLLMPLPAMAAGKAAPKPTPKSEPMKEAAANGDKQIGSNTQLPLPRFVSLKAAEANARSGPGSRYPIQWVYRREGMPVEVIDEFDVWRKIRDGEGTVGWVHKTMLAGSRNAMIKGKEAQVLRLDSETSAKPLLKAAPMVIGKLMECQKDWCRVQISGRKGWIEKKYLWGVYAYETFD